MPIQSQKPYDLGTRKLLLESLNRDGVHVAPLVSRSSSYPTFPRSAAWVRRNPVRVLPICAAYLGIMGSVGARLAELAGLVLDTAISLEAPNG